MALAAHCGLGIGWQGEGLPDTATTTWVPPSRQVRVTIRCPAAVTVTGRPTGTGAAPRHHEGGVRGRGAGPTVRRRRFVLNPRGSGDRQARGRPWHPVGQDTGRCLGSLVASCSALACCSSMVHLAVWVFGASRFFLLTPGAKSRRNRGLIADPWFPTRAPRPPARVPTRVLTGVIAVPGGDGEATPVSLDRRSRDDRPPPPAGGAPGWPPAAGRWPRDNR
jgi:hypothetical protein